LQSSACMPFEIFQPVRLGYKYRVLWCAINQTPTIRSSTPFSINKYSKCYHMSSFFHDLRWPIHHYPAFLLLSIVCIFPSTTIKAALNTLTVVTRSLKLSETWKWNEIWTKKHMTRRWLIPRYDQEIFNILDIWNLLVLCCSKNYEAFFFASKFSPLENKTSSSSELYCPTCVWCGDNIYIVLSWGNQKLLLIQCLGAQPF
jgi:hypothetical protein